MINKIFRCGCDHYPVLAEIRNGYILIKKRRYLIFSDSPLLLKCGDCDKWYELSNNGSDFIMVKKSSEEVTAKIGPVCAKCGTPIDDGACPNCHRLIPKQRIKNTQMLRDYEIRM